MPFINNQKPILAPKTNKEISTIVISYSFLRTKKMIKLFLGLAFNLLKPNKTGANRVEHLFDLQSFIQAKRIRQKQNGTILFCLCNYRTDGIRFSGFGEYFSFVVIFVKFISRRNNIYCPLTTGAYYLA